MLEDPYEYSPQPGSRFWGWTLMLWLCVIGVFCGLIGYCSMAGASDIAQVNEQGCAYISDVAITSRALSKAGVDRELAERILRSMYTSRDEDVQRLRERVTTLAYMSDAEPSEYSRHLLNSCFAAGGEVRKFLGEPV